MQVDPSRRERLLAYAGGGVFAALGVLALVLWAREGQLVYVTQILNNIANCL